MYLKVSEELLERYQHDQQQFISQLVIHGETWIHHFDSESEQQSMQWNERNWSKLSFHYTA